MESDPNPIDHIDLFPRTMRVVHFLFDQYHDEPPTHGDHFKVDEMLLTEDVSGAGDGAWTD